MDGPTAPARVLEAPPTALRVLVNRVLFRGMLFVMGIVAVLLHRLWPDKTLAWRFAKVQARNLIRLCGVRVHVAGIETLGPGPFVFAPNHQSHFDIPVLLGFLPGITRFGAKKELFREPVLGIVMRTLGMIPIDRDNPAEAITRLERATREPTSVVMFPEGTRSRDGVLRPFKKGAFVLAIRLGWPIVPVVCRGTHEVMPKGGYLSILPGDVELEVLEPIPTTGLGYDDRDALAERVRSAIQSGLSPARATAVVKESSTASSGQNG